MGMTQWLSDTGRWLTGQFHASDNTITTSQELEQAWIRGNNSPSGIVVTPAKAEQIAAVESCVRSISRAFAHLPVNVVRRENGRREMVFDHPVGGVLQGKPNGWQTPYVLKLLQMRDLLYRGNSYALKIKDGRGIREVIRIHPDRVKPKQDERTLTVSYDVVMDGGRIVEVPRSRMWHLMGESDDGIVGVSPIMRSAATFGQALATDNYSSRYFGQGAKPGGLLKTEHDINIEDRKQMREDFDQLFSNEGAWKTAFLPRGVDFEKLTMTNEEAQFLETRKMSRSEIAGLFGVPPHKIGDLEKATFSNIEEQSLEFVTDCLMPWIVLYEQSVKFDLLEMERGLSIKVNVDALLRGNAKDRAEARQIQRRNGVISANEWRQSEDMNPRNDPGGDEYIVEGNMTDQESGDLGNNNDNQAT